MRVNERSNMLKAYRIILDPNEAQQNLLSQHCGAARWAYNYALSKKEAVYKAYKQELALLTYEFDGIPEEALTKAKTALKGDKRFRIPNYMTISNIWRTERGDQIEGIDGVSPWWRYGKSKMKDTISSFAFSSGFQAADTAWKNWLDSYTGKRKGPKMGYPRYKSKRNGKTAFTLYHNKKKPAIRPEDSRHLRLPGIGVVHTESPVRILYKRFLRGDIEVAHVTISQKGGRWIASLLVDESTKLTSHKKKQTENGAIGVDLGVKETAILSNGTVFPNPRHLRQAESRLKELQQKLSRTQRGSNTRQRVAVQLAKQHARVAERRSSYLHQITKFLTTNHEVIAIEDLNVSGMTKSARGTIETPGKNVAAKAGLNRAILDAAFGEFRRQLEYKSEWYESTITAIDRFAPSSKRCSACGIIKKSLTLSDRVFKCSECGHSEDRDVNAAKNILFYAMLAE